jgi:environmental stress-induced protein Ves
MPALLIRGSELPVSRWVNGAGRKADIATGEGWMAGFAWLDEDAPFSDFTGHDRTITLIKGAGFTLRFPDHSLKVDRVNTPASFDGGWPAMCHVPGGPCVVLNAMTARDRFTHSVHIIRAEGQDIAAPEGGALVLVVLAGTLALPGCALATAHDSLRVTGTERIEGGAVLAEIRFAPVKAG